MRCVIGVTGMVFATCLPKYSTSVVNEVAEVSKCGARLRRVWILIGPVLGKGDFQRKLRRGVDLSIPRS
jgi:hypothetical protein